MARPLWCSRRRVVSAFADLDSCRLRLLQREQRLQPLSTIFLLFLGGLHRRRSWLARSCVETALPQTLTKLLAARRLYHFIVERDLAVQSSMKAPPRPLWSRRLCRWLPSAIQPIVLSMGFARRRLGSPVASQPLHLRRPRLRSLAGGCVGSLAGQVPTVRQEHPGRLPADQAAEP